ncbi:MAG: type II toxin-antitoxin system VapC family toxin [Nitrospirota bacterium]
MRYMLDTNICIYLIKRRPPAVIDRFLRCDVGQVAISSVTLAELQYGVAKSQFPEKNAEALQAFLLPLEILPFDDAAGAAYGPIRVDLEKRGVSIGAMDLMIAAHALSLDVTLVTHNIREFSRVEGLRVETWA